MKDVAEPPADAIDREFFGARKEAFGNPPINSTAAERGEPLDLLPRNQSIVVIFVFRYLSAFHLIHPCFGGSQDVATRP